MLLVQLVAGRQNINSDKFFVWYDFNVKPGILKFMRFH